MIKQKESIDRCPVGGKKKTPLKCCGMEHGRSFGLQGVPTPPDTDRMGKFKDSFKSTQQRITPPSAIDC